MSSLNASLHIATQSLLAQEDNIAVTNNNIANVNTIGYSRQSVSITEANSTNEDGLNIGGGVTINGITSVRDELLTMRIQQQTSTQSSADAQVNALTQIQTLFPSTGTSLSSSLSDFFSSLSALSSNPSSTANRQTVISSAQTLVNQFNSISAGLTGPASSLNTSVKTDVSEINALAAQAATLNQQLVQQKAAGQDGGTVSDQLNAIELQLSQLTNLSVTHTSDGDSLSIGNGTPIVLGNKSYALTTTTATDSTQRVIDAGGNDITSSISGGDLGGVISVRDKALPSLQSSLDTLANEFATAFNAAQANGYDQNGSAGKALFTVSSTVAGSAASIKLATTDSTAIAASSDTSTGGNGNVANLTALQNGVLPSGQSATTIAANLIYKVGSLTSSAQAESDATKLSLTSLNNQQASVSGVSTDEESANLIRYQQAYEAAAKVITTIASLFDTTINMIS